MGAITAPFKGHNAISLNNILPAKRTATDVTLDSRAIAHSLTGCFTKLVENLRHVIGQRGREAQGVTADGVQEPKRRRMQGLPGKGVKLGGQGIAQVFR